MDAKNCYDSKLNGGQIKLVYSYVQPFNFAFILFDEITSKPDFTKLRGTMEKWGSRLNSFHYFFLQGCPRTQKLKLFNKTFAQSSDCEAWLIKYWYNHCLEKWKTHFDE